MATPEPARLPAETRQTSPEVEARVETPTGPVPLLAPAERRKDRALPILIVGSLIVHALLFLPSLWHRADDANAPHEIPVELVQEAQAPKPPDAPATPPEAKAPQPAQPQPPKPRPPKPQPEPRKPAEPSKPADPSRDNVAERMRDLLGSMPAVALPGADAGGTDAVSYEQLVLSKVSKAKQEGRHEGIPGAASVTFHLDDAGGVASVRVVHASGDPALDAEAVAMIRRGAPYPPPPPDAQRDFTVTLRFMQLP